MEIAGKQNTALCYATVCRKELAEVVPICKAVD